MERLALPLRCLEVGVNLLSLGWGHPVVREDFTKCHLLRTFPALVPSHIRKTGGGDDLGLAVTGKTNKTPGFATVPVTKKCLFRL